MIEQIERLEDLFSKEPSTKIIEGLACIHLCMNISIAGNVDLIKELENAK